MTANIIRKCSDGFDFAAHLARIVSGDGRKVIIAVLDAFVDESGTHDSAPVVCSAGYLFDPAKAEAFSDKWKPFLKSKEIEVFHANEHFRRPDGEEIFSFLIGLIVETAEIGFLRFAQRDALDSIKTSPGIQQFIGSPYSLCTLSCMHEMGQFANEKQESVLYFVENGNEYAGELRHFMDTIKHDAELRSRFAMEDGSDTHSKKSVIQLQCADLLAWEFARAYENAICKTRDEWRLSLERLGKIPHRISGFSGTSGLSQ
jgi:Protein of unknown function (DUF3800)